MEEQIWEWQPEFDLVMLISRCLSDTWGLPQWLSSQEPSCSAGDSRDMGLIPREDPTQEEMATHSSFLIWKIPWTEEPGGLESKGSQSGR